MKKYVQKPTLVEAEQWNGQDIEGLNVVRPEVIYSLDRKLYYVTGCMPTAWLSVEKDEKTEKYTVYSFNMFEIKSDPERVPVPVSFKDADSEIGVLVRRYLDGIGAKGLKTYAYVQTLPDTTRIQKGDYVLKDEKGRYSRCTEEDFEDQYELIEQI